MKASFSILIIAGIVFLTATVRADVKWYYNVTGGSGTIKAGPFDSHDEAEAAAQKERDLGYDIPESSIFSEGSADSSSSPNLSVPGFNPVQNAIVNTPGLNFGQQLQLQAAGQIANGIVGWLLSPDPKQQQAVAINQQGVDAWKRGDNQTAINCFAQAVQLSPNDRQIEANLYRAYGSDAFHKAALAADRKDTSTVLAELRDAVANYEKSKEFVSDQYIQKDLSDARQSLEQLEDTLRRNKIAADLNGVLKMSGTPQLGGLKLSGTPPLTGSDPNNPAGLKLKITSVAQLSSAANDSSGFDGGPGSMLNTGTATATDLHPQGPSFFGLGGGSKNSSPEPTGDPNVVDLRDAKTLTVDPAVVKGESGTSQGGAGIQQGTPDKSPSPNPASQPAFPANEWKNSDTKPAASASAVQSISADDWEKAKQLLVNTEVQPSVKTADDWEKNATELLVDTAVSKPRAADGNISPKEERDILAGRELPTQDPFVQRTLDGHPEDEPLLLQAWSTIRRQEIARENQSIDRLVNDEMMPVLDKFKAQGKFQWGDSIQQKRLQDPEFREAFDAANIKVLKELNDNEDKSLLSEDSLFQSEFLRLKQASQQGH